MKKAKEAGAFMVGGPERLEDFVRQSIKATKKTGVYVEEETKKIDLTEEGAEDTLITEDVEFVDYVVATPTLMRGLTPLKKVLRNKYPTAKKSRCACRVVGLG